MSLLRQWGWETAVFRGATAVALLHALDDAFLNRQPGVEVGQHALAAAISLAAGLAAMVGFPRLRPGLRAAIALLFGVFAIVNGALHLIHVTDGGASGSDVTGVVALAAGVVLVLLGLAIPFVHRGEGSRTRARRWANRVVVVLAGVLLVYAFVFPTSAAIIQTHKYREPIGSPPSAEYETARASRRRSPAHRRTRALDRRNRRILRRLPKPGRSGRGGAVLPDDVHGRARLLGIVARRAAEGARGAGLSNAAAADRNGPRSPGRARLQPDLRGSRARAVELWDLPDVNHTAAVRERPEEYERRVIRFFEDALLARGS